jgi:hypothetical protein
MMLHSRNVYSFIAGVTRKHHVKNEHFIAWQQPPLLSPNVRRLQQQPKLQHCCFQQQQQQQQGRSFVWHAGYENEKQAALLRQEIRHLLGTMKRQEIPSSSSSPPSSSVPRQQHDPNEATTSIASMPISSSSRLDHQRLHDLLQQYQVITGETYEVVDDSNKDDL